MAEESEQQEHEEESESPQAKAHQRELLIVLPYLQNL